MFNATEPTPLIALQHPNLEKKQVEVFLKRDDLIDTEISGNKWRKLKYNLLEARSQGYHRILTFGGAYSNHIAATAAACKRFELQSIGIIRGEELHAGSNATLRKAQSDGMNLIFIKREDYRRRTDQNWLESLESQHDAFIIPEGGSNKLALRGVGELLEEISIDFDSIVCPVGTGGTLAGLAQSLDSNKSALGICCLKGADFLSKDVYSLVGTDANWSIFSDYHFGGYAKFDSHLIKFINDFRKVTGVPLDPIYTGKMMYGVFDLIKKGKFRKNSRVVCVHTGGLQGIEGFNEKHDNLIDL